MLPRTNGHAEMNWPFVCNQEACARRPDGLATAVHKENPGIRHSFSELPRRGQRADEEQAIPPVPKSPSPCGTRSPIISPTALPFRQGCPITTRD